MAGTAYHKDFFYGVCPEAALLVERARQGWPESKSAQPTPRQEPLARPADGLVCLSAVRSACVCSVLVR